MTHLQVIKRELPLICFCILVLAIGYSCTTSPIFQKVPDTFEGMKLGASIKDLPNMVLKEDFADGIKSFYCPGVKVESYEGCKVEDVQYFFENEKLCAIFMRFGSFKDYLSLTDSLTLKYGRELEKPESPSGPIPEVLFSCKWIGDATLLLDFDADIPLCFVCIYWGKDFSFPQRTEKEVKTTSPFFWPPFKQRDRDLSI